MREFSLQERRIFSYFNPDKCSKDENGDLIGNGMIFVDPFEIQERWVNAILKQEVDIEAQFKNLDQDAEGYDPEGDLPDPLLAVKFKSRRHILNFFHSVFDTKPLSPDGKSGILDVEAWKNFDLWNEFNDDVKKNTDETPSLPTSSQELKETSKHGKPITDTTPISSVVPQSTPTR